MKSLLSMKRGNCYSLFLRLACLGLTGLSLTGLTTLALEAQQTAPNRPPSPVGYTEAREHKAHRTIRLLGTVDSRTTSVVASEIEGLVEALPGREGRSVAKGATLARLRQTTIALRLQATEGQLREAEARLQLAERNHQRARELFETQLISQQQLDDTFFTFNAWQGRTDQLRADKARAEEDLDHCTIRAPFAGVVVGEHTEVGQWLDVGDAVVDLISLQELEIRVDIPERYFSTLKVGGRANITFEALPTVAIEGRISALIPRADTQARTFPLKIRIPNRRQQIGVGMLAQVTLQTGTHQAATIVPKDAVVLQGLRRVVYLLNGDSTVTPLTVETGDGTGDWIAVAGRLQPGQKVITRGNERLRPGQTVQAQLVEYALP